MLERRPTDAATSRLARRLRALLEPADAPLPKRKPQRRLDPVHRSWLVTAWQARAAVRSGMPLDDFLRARLARYLVELPVPAARLPAAIAIDDGRIVSRAAAAGPAPAPADPRGDDWAAPLGATDGPSARHEASELEVRLAVLDGQIDAARRRTEEIAHRFAGDVAAGIVAAPPAVDATAEQLGRPSVPGTRPRAGLVALAVSALGAEAWQIAVPLLASAGLDPAQIGTTALERPGDVASLALFAVGVTAALFGLAHAALSAGAALLAGEADKIRARWLAATGGASGALAAMVAASVAALPRSEIPHALSGVAFALLLLAVPVGAALAVRAAARIEAAHDEELSRALAWDRERAAALAERARRLEELRWAEDEETDLEHQRDAARRRLRDMSARANALARLAAEAAEQERAGLARLAQGVAAALELDRYAYVRYASALGMPALPARRRPPEPRPGDFVAATTPPGTDEVEAGRLAS